MGYYINPKTCSKELWLSANGKPVSYGIACKHVAGDEVIVCLVDNGPFTAAGIAYNDKERDVFATPDGRHKLWYIVRRDRLVKEGFLDE